MKKYYAYVLLVAFSLTFVNSMAQVSSATDMFSRTNVHPNYQIPWSGEVSETNDFTSDQFITWFQNTYFKNPEITWTLVKSDTDLLGMVHERYQQWYKGIEVDHGVLILHLKNSRVTSFNGEIYPAFNNGLPENAMSLEGFSEGRLERTGNEVYALHEDGLMYLTEIVFMHKEEEMILDKLFLAGPARLSIIRIEPQIIHTDVKGTANTHYIGVQNIITDSLSSSTFRLRENARPVRTFKTSLGNDFTDSDNYWNNTGERIAGDVHYGAQLVHEFFDKKFGWDSYANKGDSITSVLNLTSTGNAFWNLAGNYATFLAGSNATIGPCASIDVVGHEFGHGVGDENAGLVYSGESCMLHESLADITGTLLEWYHDSTKYNWLLGENVWSGGIRNMRNPNAFKHPDTYKGTYFPNGCHGSGGVQNYWFYLMVKGDTGTNDNSHAYSIPGLGFEKAMAIMYRAVFYYWTANTNFANANTHSLQAAKDLYGSCSSELRWTYEAWKAVGLEDTSFKVVDLTHKIIAPEVVCSVIPDTIRFYSKGDPSRKVTWYFANGDSSNKWITDYIATHTGKHTYYLRTEICDKVFWDTGHTVVTYQPIAEFGFKKVKVCNDGKDSVETINTSKNFDVNQTMKYAWTIYPYGDVVNSKDVRFGVKDPFDLVFLLRVYYQDGCWDTVSHRVTVNSSPDVSFSTQTACEGESLKITNSTDINGKQFTFKWYMDTILFSTDYQPSAVGNKPGTHSIKLEGTNTASGCKSETTKTLTVYKNPIPEISVVNPCANQKMLLINTTKHTSPPNYFRWLLPTFKPFNKDTVALTNDSSSTVYIQLEYKDQRGCYGITSKTINLENISASFELGDAFCSGTTVQPNAKVKPDTSAIQWFVGNKSIGSAIAPTIVLNDTGLHQIKLVAYGTKCKDSIVRQVRVNPNPPASFVIDADKCEGDTVHLTNTSPNPENLNFRWQWGDGTVTLGDTINHLYKLNNTEQTESFNISLRAKNKFDCESVVAKSVTINALSNCQFDFTEPHKYLLNFSPEKTTDPSNAYRWDFGDGDTSLDIKPSHQYADGGSYSVLLQIVNNAGCYSECGEDIEVGWGLGISNLPGETIRLYPNPTTGQFTLTGLEIQQPYWLELVDVNGKVVLKESIHSADGNQVIRKTLSAGIYHVHIRGNNTSHTLKLLVTP